MKIKYIVMMIALLFVAGGAAVKEDSEKIEDFTCCPDVTTSTVDVTSFCTGTEIHTVDASVATCTEYEESFFTWTWTPIQGATITPQSGDQADFLVTGAVGTDVIFRVKAVSSDPNCTVPIKSYRFVIPITSECGSE